MWKQDCGGLSIGGEAIEWEDRREREKGVARRRLGLICKWNGGGTRLNFTSNGTGNFLLGDEGGRRRGFTSNQALRRVTWRYSNLMYSSLFLYLFPCPFLALFHPQEDAIFWHAPRHLISLDETATEFLQPIELSGANFLPFSLPVYPEKARGQLPLPLAYTFVSMENFVWMVDWMDLIISVPFIRRFLSWTNRKSLILFINIFGLLDFFLDSKRFYLKYIYIVI